MINFLTSFVGSIKNRIELTREKNRWDYLQRIGMRIGKDVYIPSSVNIDVSHCFLITIGDYCRFSDNCTILAHDATPNYFIDATKIGKVIIHESCHFGFGTLILPGVEIGPNVIVGANTVINRDIPPNSVASGNPVKILGKLDNLIRYHKMMMNKTPLYPFREFSLEYLTPKKKEEMISSLKGHPGYITGGYTALKEDGKFISGPQSIK